MLQNELTFIQLWHIQKKLKIHELIKFQDGSPHEKNVGPNLKA